MPLHAQLNGGLASGVRRVDGQYSLSGEIRRVSQAAGPELPRKGGLVACPSRLIPRRWKTDAIV